MVALCLLTGWPPSEVRSLTLREAGLVRRGLEERARERRMAAAARRVKGR